MQQEFNYVIDRWLTYKQNFVKMSTFSIYYLLVRNHIKPNFGNKIKVNDNDIQEFIINKMNNGLDQKTVKDIVIVINMILKYGNKIGWNEYIKPDLEYPLKNKNKEIRILSKLDYIKLINYLEMNICPYNLGVLICLMTGLRIGEVCALKWDDIDFEKKKIKVSRTIQRIYDKNTNFCKTILILDLPKSDKSQREVPICDRLLKVFNFLLNKIESFDKFILSNNIKPIEPRIYRNHLKNLLFLNNIKQINFHGLRHTFATRCIESGADYKTLSIILGHANVKTTLDLYVHPSDEHKANCIDQMIGQFI
ncbi:MAG: tyrosine-type recombinase/integrase [Mycoplasma sp.]